MITINKTFMPICWIGRFIIMFWNKDHNHIEQIIGIEEFVEREPVMKQKRETSS